MVMVVGVMVVVWEEARSPSLFVVIASEASIAD